MPIGKNAAAAIIKGGLDRGLSFIAFELIAVLIGGPTVTKNARHIVIQHPKLQLAADLPRQSVYIYARGFLEVVDRDLRTVGQAPAGHPFLKGFRLLAGDGQGRLLWSSARRKMRMPRISSAPNWNG